MKASMDYVYLLVLLGVFALHQNVVLGQGTCKNIYEDFSCGMFQARGMCRMFRKYCALTCGLCQITTQATTTKRPPTTKPPTNGIWSTCTKTCGIGTRYRFASRRCTNPNNPRCVRRFEECNTRLCPPNDCRNNQAPRYGIRKGCCNRRGPATTAVTRKSTNGARILNGNKWPWMVLITAFGDVCGGALIHRQWVMTAAHCLTTGKLKLSTSRMFVYVGIDNLADATSQNRYNVRRTIIHPKFRNVLNDIALIELSESVRSRYASVISLPRSEITPIDSTCVVTGWGLNYPLPLLVPSRPLKEADQQILDFGVCRNHYSENPALRRFVSKRSPNLLCAGSLTERNQVCDGYSGSPLACQRCSSCDWYLAGVTTATQRGACRRTGFPTLFTQVRSFEDWVCKYLSDLNEDPVKCPYKYGP